MHRIGKKRRLITFDQMSQPGESESSRNQKQRDDPVKPDDDQRRESNRDRD
jgi:hypothetical protein